MKPYQGPIHPLVYVGLAFQVVRQSPRVFSNKLAIWLGVHQCPACEGTGRVVQQWFQGSPNSSDFQTGWSEVDCSCVTYFA